MAGHPVDVHVGTRLRQRRALLGMSQTALGAGVGLTFQQIQKYETGANRIGSSRLFEFSKILDVPLPYFFDELPVNMLVTPSRSRRSRSDDGATSPDIDPLAKRETLELVRAYYKITDHKVRKRIFEMVKAIGGAAREKRAEAMAPKKTTRRSKSGPPVTKSASLS